jgi:acetyl-CoA carboxylase biotin carboxyl carrier protein
VTTLAVKSEISGRVFDIVAEVGQRVAEDDPIIVLEAMKMEIAVTAPRAGVLVDIRVSREENVEEGQVVATMEAG